MAVVIRNTVPEEMDRACEALPVGTAYVAEALVDNLGTTSPKGKTKELSRSFSQEKIVDHEHVMESSAEHAEWVWKGTGEYVGRGPIKPKTAQCLVFFWDRIGKKTAWKGDCETDEEKQRFRRWAYANGMVPFLVWPRGIEGTPYVEEAIELTERDVPDCYIRALREAGVSVA